MITLYYKTFVQLSLLSLQHVLQLDCLGYEPIVVISKTDLVLAKLATGQVIQPDSIIQMVSKLAFVSRALLHALQ